MKLDEKIIKRFEELIALGDTVVATSGSEKQPPIAEQWGMSSLALLGRVFGQESEYYIRFASYAKRFQCYLEGRNANAVLRAALGDIRGGYLFETRRVIQAEVFDDFLEQAEYFLSEGHHQVASVIAGAVLEDTLRKLCLKNGIALPPKPKLDAMNSDLAKAGIYDKLVKKKVTWLADIRNKAAHGEWTEFTKEDSEGMVKAVRNFVTDYN
jgi:hypothetical protein